MRKPILSTHLAAVLLTAASGSAAGQEIQEHVTGLRAPQKLLSLPSGELLVAEAGNGANTGRISFIDRDARRFTVIDGLPSALGREASGPSGLLLVGRSLFVTIGVGDTVIAGAGQASEIPNPQPSSPLFSSVLLLEFPDAVGQFSMGFGLQRSQHDALAADRGVYLSMSMARPCVSPGSWTSRATRRNRDRTSRGMCAHPTLTGWSGVLPGYS